MVLSVNNSQQLSVDNSIINSSKLQQHLVILSCSFQDLEAKALELLETNPAVDHYEVNQHFSSASALDLIQQQNKEHPFEQIPTKLLSSHDKILAEEILQSVCEEGFLQQEEKSFLSNKHGHDLPRVLEIVQNFTGIGFENRLLFWRSLLLKDPQFRMHVELIDRFTTELLNGDFTTILKFLKINKEEFKNTFLKVFKTLPLSPIISKKNHVTSYYIDAEIVFYEDRHDLVIASPIPKFSLSPLLSSDDIHVKRFYKSHINNLELFLQGVKKRSRTFRLVLEKLITLQKSYLRGDAPTPLPINPTGLAESLNLHPSTLARCLQNKIILTPRGLIELKSLATPSPLDSNKQDLLIKLRSIVSQENKQKPHTDEMLLKILRDKGWDISRRTIVKYRKKLNIPDAKTRAFLA